MEREEAGDYVGRCASLAALLEVSAYPKPGNVHRTRDIPGTRFEHFLTGGVAMGPAMRRLALHGYDASSGIIPWNEIGIGGSVLDAVKESMSWQSGGNVNLGIVLLFSPISAAGGATLQSDGKIELDKLRKKLGEVTRYTTAEDAVNVYRAIGLSMKPETLGSADELDVSDNESQQQILEQGTTLLEVFELCAGRDSICDEWFTDFEITFETGAAYLDGALKRTGDINSAVVDTYLHVLSGRPDSLIVRKSGLEKARYVSEQARKVLEEGGSSSISGMELVRSLDEELHAAGGLLNPGTTADLTAASIFVSLLAGWRP